jgi:hypothetical protein
MKKKCAAILIGYRRDFCFHSQSKTVSKTLLAFKIFHSFFKYGTRYRNTGFP